MRLLRALFSRRRRRWEAWTFPPSPVLELARAIADLPAGWWWTVGECGLSSHASIGPDARNPACAASDSERFDVFDADFPQPSTPAQALRACVLQARLAIAAWEPYDRVTS